MAVVVSKKGWWLLSVGLAVSGWRHLALRSCQLHGPSDIEFSCELECGAVAQGFWVVSLAKGFCNLRRNDKCCGLQDFAGWKVTLEAIQGYSG